MDLKAEKRTGAVLAAVALLVMILLPLVFRELEPDYDAAYSMDPSRKRRFAQKDGKAPELPNLPPSASAAASAEPDPLRRKLDVSAHRALPAAGQAGAAEASAEAKPAAERPGAADAAAPRLAPSAGRPAGGETSSTARFPALDESRTAKLDDSRTQHAAAGPGSAQAARLAQSMGFGDVPALLEAGKEAKSNRCAEEAARLRPRLRAATVAYKAASAELEGSGCAKDSCGRYADDCAQRERGVEEGRVAARRCRCDKLACRRNETCRAVDELTCRQETACGADASQCASRCL